MLSRKKTTALVIIIVFLTVNNSFSGFHFYKPIIPTTETSLYELLDLSGLGLKENIFRKALAGWKKLYAKDHLENPSVLSIVDLSQSSNSKRLYVIDMVKKCILF